MIRVHRSGVIDAPVAAVWRLLRDFNSHVDWHPAVAASRIEGDGPPDVVGAVRAFRLRDGGFLREQLIALDDRALSLTYCVLEAPLPLIGYVATMRLRPVTDGDRSFVDWRSSFDTPAAEAEALAILVGDGIYAAGIAALQARLGRAAGRLFAPVERPVAVVPPLPPTAATRPVGGTIETAAIVVERHGGPDVLVPRTVPVPPPGPGEIRIRHEAIGVNMIDVHGRAGAFGLPTLPATPGMEGAGTVLDAGPGVGHLRPGDRVVYAGPPPGSYAAVRNLPAAIAVPLPPDLDAVTAAALFLKGITADLLLHDVHPVGAGALVLVQAAAGGLGLMLCGWARGLGAEVVGVVSDAAKAEAARVAGCDRVIVGAGRVGAEIARLTGGLGVDVVFDPVGRASFAGSVAALAPGGHLVSYGQISGAIEPADLDALAAKGIRLSRPNFATYTAGAEALAARAARLFEAVRRGLVRPLIDSRWPLAEAADAHRRLASRRNIGSIVLVP